MRNSIGYRDFGDKDHTHKSRTSRRNISIGSQDALKVVGSITINDSLLQEDSRNSNFGKSRGANFSVTGTPYANGHIALGISPNASRIKPPQEQQSVFGNPHSKVIPSDHCVLPSVAQQGKSY